MYTPQEIGAPTARHVKANLHTVNMPRLSSSDGLDLVGVRVRARVRARARARARVRIRGRDRGRIRVRVRAGSG